MPSQINEAVDDATSKACLIQNPRLSKLSQEKYLLQVSAGPSYDETTHVPVVVNSNVPTLVENEFMKAAIHVRIRSYQGLPLQAPSSSTYFSHASRLREQYSIGFSFVPKMDIPSTHTLWGNDFDHPIRDRLPPGFSLAVRIVKEFVDPSIDLDAYADEPWMYAPSLCSFFAFRIGEKKPMEQWKDIPVASDEEPLQEGADDDGRDVRMAAGLPEHPTNRRRHFRSIQNREGFIFEAGRLYQADFFNPYIDFASMIFDFLLAYADVPRLCPQAALV
jgi:hypothetical protein